MILAHRPGQDHPDDIGGQHGFAARPNCNASHPEQKEKYCDQRYAINNPRPRSRFALRQGKCRISSMLKLLWLLVMAAAVAAAQEAAPASAAASPLDFEVYRTRVEPIFLKARQPGEGSGAACVSCHARIATRLRLQPLAPGATS